MLTVPGYDTLEKIHEGKHTLVFRGRADKDGQPVIFKTVNSVYPGPEEIARLKREYEITAGFQFPGVIRALGLVSVQNRTVIILEDFGGVALGESLEQGPLELGEFLSLAVGLAEILGEIHARNIIHKDINPANIVWNRDGDIVKIIDFSISLALSREVTGIKNPNVLEGTLAYISPEQTGRMNRFLDYRTDYYSLGVTFFRMLAGRLPFESRDPMELVYAHIARQPPALHELEGAGGPGGKIPQAVSDIVLKLMAKNVEDRYQSAGGLVADLKRCREDFLLTGIVGDFTPGRVDVSDRFQIPQKLFGREGEIAALLRAFERAGKGDRELMLVTGLPGIGKSALVNEIHKPIVKLRANFIAGKYDKFQKDVPYSALLQAFSGLVKHLLAENEDALADWKRKILAALGPNGRVITDVIPELELVIGLQPEIPELGPDESRNRFNLYFQFFMDVFCKAEHPLVLFLDDLQWADHASLDMMKLFLSDPDVKFLFVIGAFRSNEVDADHYLHLILDEIRIAGTGVNSMSVTPLGERAVTDLLRESLHCEGRITGPLTELLLRKTGGNPFFLGEFLKSLYQDELLQFKPDSGWSWDMQKIEALQVTDNVVKLMAAKIESLPGDCGALLKLGACFGNRFEAIQLEEITGKPGPAIQGALTVLLEEGLLIKLEHFYKFIHDRIQEAAYGLIPEDERMQEHLRIGRLELERTEADNLPQRVFYIVNQLNAARPLISLESEKMELAELNLLAGVKARSAAAYRPALNYLDIALGFLNRNAWNERYDFILKVHQEAAMSAFLWGDFERMEQLANTVIQNARDSLDAVPVYEAKIFSAIARNQLLEAVRIGLTILKELGVSFSENPGKAKVVLELLSVKWTLWGKSIQDLENISPLEDVRKLAIMRIQSGIGTAAYFAMPDLLPVLVLKMLTFSVKYGNTEFSPYSAYVGYGLIQCGVLGNMEAGYNFGQLALRLIEKLNVQDGKARTLLSIQYLLITWKKHLRNTLEPLQDVIRLGMETGDPEFTCHAANGYIEHSFFCGRELIGLEKEHAKFHGMIEKRKQLYSLHQSRLNRQLFLNLLGDSEDPCVMKGDSYDFEAMLPVHLEGGDFSSVYRVHSYSCFLNYMFGRYTEALKHVSRTEPYLDSMMATFSIPWLNFYESLSQLALYQTAPKSVQKKYMARVRGNQKRMKHWAAHAPMNFEHKYRLVEAELARVRGLELKARDHYEAAIQGARDNQYSNEEALALELFAKFWLEPGKDDIGGLYMHKARQAYGSWGALAKVRELETNYSHLLSLSAGGDEAGVATGGSRGSSGNTTSSEHETTGRSPSGKLDLATVVKASQTIAGEIILSRSLEKMMKIVMENAGARKGFLILEVGGELYIEAAGFVDQDTVTVLQAEPVKGSDRIPAGLIFYVARTKETVVLKDASRVGEYTTDAYILENNVASVLCAPVLNQGKLSGVLYLENNAATGAFTGDRVEVLGMLSAQIAVSIDNARLYGHLEEKVKERTTQLESANTKLRKMDELKNDLFTNISHEIRTPLTLILSPLDNLMQNEAIQSDPAQLGLLNIMAANGRRLLKQVNDMLDLAKFDADKMLLQYQRTDIVLLIRKIALTFRSFAESKAINLRIIGDSPFLVAVDPEKFEKAILNLLGNAFKFTESGEIRIEIFKNDSGDKLRIRILDSGVGVPIGQEEVIFQRFSRADAGEVQEQVGTGIGLALVREIVNMHKGRVWAEPVPAGAEFIIELPIGSELEGIPLYTGAPTLDDGHLPYIGALVSEDAGVERFGESGMTAGAVNVDSILIVEDNQDMRDYLVSILEPQFQVIQAENGKVGLELARKHLPGLILSDVMMPELDGLEMLGELRKQEDTKMTPVVMLSARSELEQKLEGLGLGADDYIAKPFRPAELLLKIRNLLHKNSLFELERHKERESVFADLHDYLGGSLTDMSIMAKRMKRTLESEDLPPAHGEHIEQLETIVKQAVLNYRQCFAKVEELNHLQGEFVDALNLILLGRYSNFEREINFQGDYEINRIFQDQRFNSLRQVLYAVIMEIATNDLKYGMGLSRWTLGVSDGNEFLLEFSAGTDMSKLRKEAGRGTGNIHRRIENVGGVVDVSTGGGRYELSMRVAFVGA